MIATTSFFRRILTRSIPDMMEKTKYPPTYRRPDKAAKRPLSTSPRCAVIPAFASDSPVSPETTRFADLAKEQLLDPILLQTIVKDLKFDRMMPVQAATLRPLLSQRIDCLVQAKTGTGKTLAFLLPGIQTLLKKQTQTGVSILVISPTRELALQIAKEASALLSNLPRYKVCVAIGGTNKNTEQSKIRSGCDILIATPGRLNDHLSDSGFSGIFKQLDTLVLDEADRLLDMGFLQALKDIVRSLPDKTATKRQGMLFSATIAPHVENVAQLVVSPGYKFISTIPRGESNIHERVSQELIAVDAFSDVAAALVGSLRREKISMGPRDLKAIVFAPTARAVDFYAQVLEKLPDLPPISLLHSRLTQSKRGRVADDFRTATNGIMVATDVIARGMDFPKVTHVIQAGLPADKESYIHRLGRTARAGAEGRGTFIVTKDEMVFATNTLIGFPFQRVPADLSAKGAVYDIAKNLSNHQEVYQAWLGYYKTHRRILNYTLERLVAEANRYALDGLGAATIPGLKLDVLNKMGLRGTNGLVVLSSQTTEMPGRRAPQKRRF